MNYIIRKFAYNLSIFALGLIAMNPIFGQEEASHQTEEEFHHHSIGVLLSHSFISQGKQHGDRDWLIVPSWAINYNYQLNEKWVLGWHNDLIIEEFLVEDSREETAELERSFPFSTMLIGTYKASENWGLAFGGGAEFEKNESFGLIRLGTEYGVPIPGLKLEVVFALNYDMLIDAYDSINFGVGIVKLF